MIVVDSSVWIANIRGSTSDAVRKLDAANPSEILVGDLILLEVMQGARNDRHAALIEQELRAFEIAPMLSPMLAAVAASNFRKLRSAGVTLRNTPDLIIGTFCLEGGHELIHDDRDFRAMELHLGLRCL